MNFIKKFDDYSNIKNFSYLFAENIKTLIKSEMIAVIKYTYSKTEILASVPFVLPTKNTSYSQELFSILKNLEQENITLIQNKDIQSEHFKKFFPLYNFEKYYISPLYVDDETIVTLEIYNEAENAFLKNEKIMKEFINVFQKIFIQQHKFNKKLLLTKKNEIIINFLDKIRHTLDINELEEIISEEMCRIFHADRTYFLRSNKNDLQTPILEKEYLCNPYVKSLRGNNLDFKAVWEQLQENKINPPVFVIEDVSKFVKQNQLEGSAIDTFLQKSNIKSSYPFLVFENDEIVMYLVIQYTQNVTFFSKDDFEIMEVLTRQTYLALSQSKLQGKLIKNSEEEKLLIDLISIARNSLDIKKVANEFTSKVNNFFNADRCIIRFYDEKEHKFQRDDDAFEYKKHYYTTGTQNYELSKELDNFLLKNEKTQNVFSLHYSNELFDENVEYSQNIKNYADKFDIKSYFVAYIRYNDKLLGILSLHFKTRKNLQKNDENLLKALADELGIAIHQSGLYANIQNIAKKEKFLKEVYADTFTLQNKKQIYKYFTEKLMQLLEAVGAVFIDFANQEQNQPVYYENYKTQYINISKFKNFNFINDIIKKHELSYECKLNTEDEETQKFILSSNITCIATLPISDNIMLILFFDKQKEFTTFEKSLLFSFIEVISKTIEDNIRKTEINNLRKSFLSTLAHDLHIPIIAERNAIKYLLSLLKEEDDNSQIKNILKEIDKTNSETENMVKALTSIYKYESFKKELLKQNCNILTMIDSSIQELNNILQDKNIKINKKILTDNFNFWGDETEISKVLTILLRKAIYDTANNGEIKITLTDDGKYLKYCITSNGKNIEINSDNEKMTFDRMIMTNNIEQRIGEGIYLYLAKVIINSHNGTIYFNNKHNGGNIFCLELEKII